MYSIRKVQPQTEVLLAASSLKSQRMCFNQDLEDQLKEKMMGKGGSAYVAGRMGGLETQANTQWPLRHGQLRDVKD